MKEGERPLWTLKELNPATFMLLTQLWASLTQTVTIEKRLSDEWSEDISGVISKNIVRLVSVIFIIDVSLAELVVRYGAFLRDLIITAEVDQIFMIELRDRSERSPDGLISSIIV